MAKRSSPIRVGLVGYGYAGRTIHVPLIAATAGMALVAVTSRDPEKVRADLPETRVFENVAEMLGWKGIDLVVVATPVDIHASIAHDAIRAGKHVVVEQPFTRDFVEARGLMALAKKHGRLLSVFHKGVWETDFHTLRRAIEEDVLGRVTHFESHIDRRYPRDAYLKRPGPEIDLQLEIGPDLVSQAVRLFGLPSRVQASLAHQRSGTQGDDWMHVVMEYGEGLRAILHGGLLAAHGFNRFVVHGEKGTCIVRNGAPVERMVSAGRHARRDEEYVDHDVRLYDGSKHPHTTSFKYVRHRSLHWQDFYEDLGDAVRGTGPNPSPPMEVLAVIAVLDAISDSARTGQCPTLELIQKEYPNWDL